MRLPLARPTAREVRTLWGIGLLVEAVLLLVASVFLERPELPLVEQLRGPRDPAAEVTVSFKVGASSVPLPPQAPPVAEEDSFYTIVHWPLHKPLLEGGGHVVMRPMRLLWLPALYLGAVPLLLVGITGAWLWTRRRAPAQ